MNSKITNFIKGLVSVILWLCIGFVAANFSDGAKRDSVVMEPSFAPLDEGEDSFVATIYDDATESEIQDISFFGHTSIGGIRKETDDSMNKLKLGNMRELEIIKSSYESKRFRDREFTLVKLVTANGTVVENLLVPQHVVICGIDKKSQMERSWFLSKIKKMVIEKMSKTETPEATIDKVFKNEQRRLKNDSVAKSVSKS